MRILAFRYEIDNTVYIKRKSLILSKDSLQWETHVPERHFCSDVYYHNIKTDNEIKVRYINYDNYIFQCLEYIFFFYLHFYH